MILLKAKIKVMDFQDLVNLKINQIANQKYNQKNPNNFKGKNLNKI